MNRISMSEIKKENVELKTETNPDINVPVIKPTPNCPNREVEPPIKVPAPHTTEIYNMRIGEICYLIKRKGIRKIIIEADSFKNSRYWTIKSFRFNRLFIFCPYLFIDRVEKDIKKKLSDEGINIEVYSRNSRTMRLRKKTISNKLFYEKKRMKD
jgi:hypothetical protein